MIRAILMLLFVGVAGMVAIGLVSSLVVPIFGLALKIAFVLLVGYLILRLVRPDKAEDIRKRFKTG